MKQYNEEQILLINVPQVNLGINFNAGLVYIKGYLDANNIQNDILDLNFNYIKNKNLKPVIITQYDQFNDIVDHNNIINFDYIKQQILSNITTFKSYDILAFSIIDQYAAIIFKYIYNILQENDVAAKVVLGGSFFQHSNNFLFFDDHPEIDICRKYGEHYFQAMFDLPDFELYSYNQYYNKNDDPFDRPALIVYSTGCINHCIFCLHRKINSTCWYRNLDHIINEFIFLKQQNKTIINLCCENASNNIAFFNKFTQRLKLENKDQTIQWSTNFSMLSEYDEKIDFQSIKEAGCQCLKFGIESLNYNIRKRLGKPNYTLSDITYMFDNLLAHDIHAKVNIMVGFVNETSDDFAESLEETRIFFLKYKDIIDAAVINLYLVHNKEQYCGYDVKFDNNGRWYYNDNTFEVRLNRLNQIIQLAEEIGIPLSLQSYHKKVKIY